MNQTAPALAESPTRRRLLEVGRRLFAQRGFAGTSVRALTREAGTNLGAVTYHFGGKEGLYGAVLAACLEPLRRRLEEIGRQNLPALDGLEAMVRGFFRHLAENPDMPRFMVQELVLGEHPHPEVVETIRAVLGALTAVLRKGQKEGSIVGGDPVLQALTVLSQPVYLSVVPAILRKGGAGWEGIPRPHSSPEEHGVSILRRALASGRAP